MLQKKSFSVFGDSIMKGVLFDRNARKYYIGEHSDAEAFSKEFNVTVTNNSRFGCTVAKGLDRVNRSLSRGEAIDVALIEYGGNDCDFNWAKVAEAPTDAHQPNTPLPLFLATYEKIIDTLRENGIVPVMMNLPPINAEKYLKFLGDSGFNTDNILAWLGDTSMIYRYQEMYSNEIVALAARKDCILIDTRSYFLSDHRFSSLICEDGIHPSEEGHKLIYRAIIDTVNRFVGQILPA